MTVERKQKDVFAYALRFAASIHAPAALRETGLCPVGGAITTAAITRCIYQRFQQHRLSAVSGEPVAGQLPRRQREDMAGQIGHSHPGHDQKAAVIDYQRKIGLADCLVPADVLIPRRHLPGGAGEQQAGQQWAGRLQGANEIAQLCAVRHFVTEVVVTLNILPKQTAVVAAVEQLQLHGKVIADGTGEWRLRIAEFIPLCRTRTRLLGLERQPRQPSAFVQCLQEQETFPALESSIWAAPLQQFANRVRQFGQAQSGKPARDLPDQIEFLRFQFPTTERQTTTDGHWHDASPARCRSSCSPYRNTSGMSREILVSPAPSARLTTLCRKWPISNAHLNILNKHKNSRRRHGNLPAAVGPGRAAAS